MGKVTPAPTLTLAPESKAVLELALAEKYGKSHVFHIKTREDFKKHVSDHKYPVVLLFYKE